MRCLFSSCRAASFPPTASTLCSIFGVAGSFMPKKVGGVAGAANAGTGVVGNARGEGLAQPAAGC